MVIGNMELVVWGIVKILLGFDCSDYSCTYLYLSGDERCKFFGKCCVHINGMIPKRNLSSGCKCSKQPHTYPPGFV